MALVVLVWGLAMWWGDIAHIDTWKHKSHCHVARNCHPGFKPPVVVKTGTVSYTGPERWVPIQK